MFDHTPPPATEQRKPVVNGALTPRVLMQDSAARNGKGKGKDRGSSISSHPLMRRSSVPPPLPGGLLNFARFETSNIDGLIEFLQELISSSAKANRVSEERMKSNVKVMATGGGAHMYYERLKRDLGVEVLREEEMECLILGLGFIAHVPEEVFWFSEELVYKVSHPHEPRTIPASELPRPSPSPPSYQVTFAPTSPNDGEGVPVFPCLVVNIGSGVSIVKVDENGEFERVSGTSLGGGTLWGLLSMLTDARTFDGESTTFPGPSPHHVVIIAQVYTEMLALSEAGDNAGVDMLVGDIYGTDASKIGLKSSTIASTFGKVFRKSTTRKERSEMFRQADIARSLLYAISNNIGHVA